MGPKEFKRKVEKVAQEFEKTKRLLLFGSEDFLKNLFIKEIQKRLLIEKVVFKENLEDKEIRSLSVPTLFRKPSLFILKNSKTLLDKFSSVPKGVYLLALENELLKKDVDNFKNKGFLTEKFEKISKNEAISWAQVFFHKFGKKVSEKSLAQFVDICEEDLFMMFNEAKKVCFSKDEKNIDEKDLFELLILKDRRKAYNFISSVLKGERSSISKIFKEDSYHPLYFISAFEKSLLKNFLERGEDKMKEFLRLSFLKELEIKKGKNPNLSFITLLLSAYKKGR